MANEGVENLIIEETNNTEQPETSSTKGHSPTSRALSVEHELKEKLEAKGQLANRYAKELEEERAYRQQLERTLEQKSKESADIISDLTDKIHALQKKFNEAEQKLSLELSELTEKHNSLTAGYACQRNSFNLLSDRYQRLSLHYDKTAAQMREEQIALPENPSDLQFECLRLREALIEAQAVKEHIEEEHASEIEAMHSEIEQAKIQMKANRYNPEVEDLQQTISDLEQRLGESLAESSAMAKSLDEYRQRCIQLQTELDTAELVQKDFVKLSQRLQIQLEKIRQAEQEVRWQFPEDVTKCNSCDGEFRRQTKTNCHHCGKIFCASCINNTVRSGPNGRAARVCNVCHTLLNRTVLPICRLNLGFRQLCRPRLALAARRIPAIRLLSTAAPNSEKFEFQAETKSLLDIVAKSLYSEQEVFLRELISNASDALEKRRFAESAAEMSVTAAGDQVPYEIRITTEDGKLVIEDTGIGMDKNDLVNLLGTIAKSGSKEFRDTEKNGQGAESIIGQFGVGFYSAFMVADKVTVFTRKHDEGSLGYKWSWDGTSSYEIVEDDSARPGCRVELVLRSGDAARFSEKEVVNEIINKYSYFVTVPVMLNGERVNTMNAIWTMNTGDVTAEMHDTFFRQLAKTFHPHLAHDRPRYTLHYKADAPLNLRTLLYVPTHKVSQMEFATEYEHSGVSLYARKILIKADAKELLPKYLRFLVGVVDSEDIPLNLSREMLQNDSVIVKLRHIITERFIRFLVSEMKKDRARYTEFYSGYSMFFKEGIVVEQDFSVKEQIARLLLFDSSNFRSGTQTSLDEYIERMQTDQDTIYYLFSPSRQLSEQSPYYEVFKQQNKETLFVHDAADELVLLMMNEFRGKKIMSVEAFIKKEGIQSEKEQIEIIRDVGKKELLDWIKVELGSVKVHDIQPMSTSSEHPLVITAVNQSAMRHILRVSQPKEMEHLINVQPVVHVNFMHPVIKGLIKLRRDDEKLAANILDQIYDNALITAGLMKDVSSFVPRINKILGDLLQKDKPTILTP